MFHEVSQEKNPNFEIGFTKWGPSRLKCATSQEENDLPVHVNVQESWIMDDGPIEVLRMTTVE